MGDEVDKDSLLNEFKGVTEISDMERARFFLESANWNLDLAISAFFDNPDMETSAEPTVMEAEPPKSGQDKKADDKKDAGSAAGGVIHFNDDDSDDEGQAFFAGGSSTSGQQILGPPRKKGADFVSEMFKKARESGAEVVDPSSASGSGSSRSTFSGGAYRLGSDETSSQRIENRGPAAPAPPREFTLKMWSNGFSIDDGPLRAYNDPENRGFLKDVMEGRIPRELIREARGGEVHVNMEDHKVEEYVKPKATVKPFQGQGMMLGSAAPEVVSNAQAQSAPADPKPLKKKQRKISLVMIPNHQPVFRSDCLMGHDWWFE